MQSIRQLIPYLLNKRGSILVFILTNLLSVIFSMISLALLIPFLNLLFGREELITQNPGWKWSLDGINQYFKYFLSNIVVTHQDNKLWALGFICVLVLCSILLKNTFLFISRYTLHPLRNTISKKLKSEVYKKILDLPISFFNNERKGDVLARLTNDMKEIEESILSIMDLLFSIPFTIIFYLIFMLYISPQLCLVLFILLPIGGHFIGKVSKRLKSQSTDNSQRIGNLLSIVEETLSGLRVIKAFRAESRLQSLYEQENSNLFHLNNKIAKRRELASPLSETLAIVILVIILMYGGKLVLVDKSIDAGTFIMFILVFTQLIDPLKKFSQIFYNIQKGAASLDRINSILKVENSIHDKPNALSIHSLEKGIEFQNVNFQYADKKILDNVNIEIEKGKMIAIVGASGSGKSTLVDLIPRFHDVASGQILIDGTPITELKIDDLRKLIGYVGQEPILFNDTIAQNISLEANPDPLRVENAARIALAHDFIMKKEKGYETNIGDRGSKLSGGERQRLTIARAVYKDPPILILDEATSSLDTESERYVQDALVNLMKDRTTIVIAHRLSTVQNADHIYVLQNGKIIEEGNHQSLLKIDSYYKKLVEMQQL